MFTGYHNEALNQVSFFTNNKYNWPVYSALEVQATKQTSQMQLLASYTRSFQHIAGTWQPNDPASFIQPNAFANDRGIGDSSLSDSNSLSGNAMTGAPWKPHVARVGWFYRAPWQFLLATNFTYESGAWSGPIVTNLPAPDPQFGPPTVTLSNGRIVSNPLATTIRFAFATRGDGQFRLPGVHTWNLRVGRDFPNSTQTRRVEVGLDVFNVTNAGGYQQLQFGANQLYSPSYGLGTARQLPRAAQVTARVIF